MAIKVAIYIVRSDKVTVSVWSERLNLELTRVPTVGEFIDIYSHVDRPHDDWYKVEMVIHAPSDPETDANLFVTPVDYHEAIPPLGRLMHE